MILEVNDTIHGRVGSDVDFGVSDFCNRSAIARVLDPDQFCLSIHKSSILHFHGFDEPPKVVTAVRARTSITHQRMLHKAAAKKRRLCILNGSDRLLSLVKG